MGKEKALQREAVAGTKQQDESAFKDETRPSSPYKMNPLLRLQSNLGNRLFGGMVQAKLKIGLPNDRFEQEADRVADRIMGPSWSPAMLGMRNNRRLSATEQHQPTDLVVQPKLKIGQPGDRYEREADRVAEQVMRMPARKLQRQKNPMVEDDNILQTKSLIGRISPLIQRLFAEDEEEGAVQRKCSSCANSSQPCPKCAEDQTQKEQFPDQISEPPAFENASDLTTGGILLPQQLRAFYEQRFGYDLSAVRVHLGSKAQRRSQAIHAHAFAYGNHIWLGQNHQLSPSFVMAHELVHVIQQKQPARLVNQSNPNSTSSIAMPSASFSSPRIQRAFYWVPGFLKPESGTKIHNELTPEIAKENGALNEIAVPNADREANVGLSFKGQADFYRGQPGTGQIGLYFEKGIGGASCGESELGIPATLKGNGSKGKPKIRSGKIIQANNAPTQIEMGELKPANKEQLSFGARQLASYEAGIQLAREQTNCWLENAKKPGKTAALWPAITFKSLALKPPAKYEYKPASPGKSRSLVVASFTGSSSRSKLGLPGKSEGEGVKLEFSPQKEFGERIMGDLYTVDIGNGLMAYFARPFDPESAIKLASIARKDKVAAAAFATQLQNEVIDPIFKAPEKVSPLAWSQYKGGSPKKTGPVVSSAPQQQIQRKTPIKKSPKLVDKFKFSPWNRRRKKLAEDFNQGKRVGAKGKRSLQFLNLIYQAEESLDNISGIPKPPTNKKLPPKSQNEVNLDRNSKAKKGKAKRKTKPLADLFGWMKAWTSPPIQFLGRLRETFGKGFVRVARFVSDLRTRLQGRLDNARNKEKKKGGTSYAAVAVRAFWRAAAKIGGVIFRKTFSLLVDSLSKGLQKKLSDLIPFDDAVKLQEMVDNDFPILRDVEKQLIGLEVEAKKQIDAVVKQFDDEMKTLTNLAEKAKKYGKYIKWAMIALQCASPPGLGCLKLLARGLIAKAIEEILSWCWTQKKFNSLVVATGWFDNFPSTLAEGAADKIEGILPNQVKPVFDRSVFKEIRRPKASDIPCSEQTSAKQIAIAEVHDELKEKLGPDGYEALIEALEKYGVAPSDELTIEQIQAIRDKIPGDVTAEEIKEYLKSIPTPKRKKGDPINVAEFLNQVKKATRKRRIKGAKGLLKSDSKEFKEFLATASPNQFFVAVSKAEVDRGRAVSTTMLEKGSKNKPDAAGVADIDIHNDTLNCDKGEVEIVFTKIEIFDENDNQVTSIWEGKTVPLKMNESLKDKVCPTTKK